MPPEIAPKCPPILCWYGQTRYFNEIFLFPKYEKQTKHIQPINAHHWLKTVAAISFLQNWLLATCAEPVDNLKIMPPFPVLIPYILQEVMPRVLLVDFFWISMAATIIVLVVDFISSSNHLHTTPFAPCSSAFRPSWFLHMTTVSPFA